MATSSAITSPSTNTSRKAKRIESTSASKKLLTTGLGTVSPAAETKARRVAAIAMATTTTTSASPTPRRLSADPRFGATATEAMAAARARIPSTQTSFCRRPTASRAFSILATASPSARTTSLWTLLRSTLLATSRPPSTRRCWKLRSTLPRSIVSSPLLRSSALASPVSTLEIVLCAARLASTHSVLKAGLAVKRLAAAATKPSPHS